MTDQLHRRDRSSANAENLRAEGMPNGSKRNRPVFTGESVYSINSKTKKQSKESSSKIPKFMQDFAQKMISGGTLLRLWDKLSKMFRVPKDIQKSNNKSNKKTIAQMITDKKYTEGKVINNQNEWKDVKFGSGIESDMAFSGCEIFAAYNAMVKLGEKITGDQLADMITAFEKNGATLKGDFGTSPIAVFGYLYNKYKDNRYVDVKMYASEKQNASDQAIDEFGDQNDIFIATVYNDAENIEKEIHTVCISKEGDGSYTVYNACGEEGGFKEKDGCKSLSDAIGNISANPQLISLICIDETKIGDFPFTDDYRAKA